MQRWHNKERYIPKTEHRSSGSNVGYRTSHSPEEIIWKTEQNSESYIYISTWFSIPMPSTHYQLPS